MSSPPPSEFRIVTTPTRRRMPPAFMNARATRGVKLTRYSRSHLRRRPRFRRYLNYNVGRANPRPKAELKAFDIPTGNQIFTAAGFVATLNAPVTGTDMFNRVGRKIYMKSVFIRAFIQPVVGPVAADVCRIIVFYDAQTNGVLPTGPDLLKDSTLAAVSSGMSSVNLINRERFKILRDQQIIIPAYATNITASFGTPNPIDNFNITMFIPLRGLETVYNANNGGTSADIGSGGLFIMTIDQNNQSHILSYNSRLRYYD